jgi:DnaJ homolog subfamily A member 2
VYSTKIRLVEALTGFEFHITTLDDRLLVVKSEPGSVVKPGDIKMIPNEGMPLKGGGLAKGKLFIKFDIIFPTPADLNDEKKRYGSVTHLPSFLP